MRPTFAASLPDFRLYLQEALVQRCKSNPAYSLRAFARHLQLEPSFLSKMLSGKRSITVRMISRLGQRLDLDPETITSFASPLSRKHASTVALDPTMEPFTAIADWYHYAILELAKTSGFVGQPRVIARKLGITTAESRAALERLQRLGMLVLDLQGKSATPSANQHSLCSPLTTAAFLRLQKQILEQAIFAMDEVPLEEREQTSMTIGIHPALLPKAKTLIKKFRRDLSAMLQQSGPPYKEVYQVSLSVFPARSYAKRINQSIKSI